ncbi:SDR family oxidoreductase [Streptomyces sp. SID8352]|uniref:SDR family oxidoreductase n=1 Tax=Streptomyces sp. SID8352 TaxID=2690338 RepID=UPI0013711F46|nr:SDR family oxidoreductase [Streptomyces sp. SID8352]MYU22001.1 SDR family oxidoreductase [Streptomyces sp. SID8352]
MSAADPFGLSGRRVFVSAGASGIGLATAQRFQEVGAEVLVSDSDASALKSAAAAGLRTIKADAASGESIVEVVAAIGKELGGLDVLVNNAGIAGPTAAIEQVELADWQATMRINVDSQFLHIKHLTPLLCASKAPAIVNLSSVAGLRAFRDRSAYSASKWAVVGLTKTAAAELGPAGIRVNAVCPGVIAGPRLDRVIAAKADALGIGIDEARGLFVAQTALGKESTARDVADAIVFLAGDLARTISGQVLSVDGFIEKMA